MKTWLLIYSFLFLVSCKSDNAIKIGSYQSVRFNKFELGILYVFKGIKGAYVGCKIELKNDSSFVYTTCGSIMNGI